MVNDKTAKALFWIYVFLVMTLLPTGVLQAMDSTNVSGITEITLPTNISILGRTENNKLCSYKSVDKKVHCISNLEGQKEYKVAGIVTPSFPRFQAQRIGSIVVQKNTVYGFISPIKYKKEGSKTIVCKLALEFEQNGKPVVWVWYDEIRFEGAIHKALIDDNGDGFIDRILEGRWNGKLYGSKKWWTPNPFDGSYTNDERSYTHRPQFGNVNGQSRGCDVESVKVAQLSAIN